MRLHFSIFLCVFACASAAFDSHDTITVTEQSLAVPVLVNLCNAFPGSALVSFSGGGVVSARIPYQNCTTAFIDNTTTTLSASLWPSASASTPNQTWSAFLVFPLCLDGNRNIFVAWNEHAGATDNPHLGFKAPVISCDTLPSNQSATIYFHADCALNWVSGYSALDFVLSSGGHTTTIATGIVCGSFAFTNGAVPLGPGGTAMNDSHSLIAYASGTQVAMAGPIDPGKFATANGDGTLLVVLSGDATHEVSAWTAVTQPASGTGGGSDGGPTITPNPATTTLATAPLPSAAAALSQALAAPLSVKLSAMTGVTLIAICFLF